MKWNVRVLLVSCVTGLFANVAGCISEPSNGAQQQTDSGVHDMRRLAEVGDRDSAKRLIEGLNHESETVRLEAKRGLETLLKRKIYFDPSASQEERNRTLDEVRAMWRNIEERDLFEVLKKRSPVQYFYDMNTKEVFEARAGRALIETKSGPYEGIPAGVRAVVWACRDCGDDRFAAWLQVPIAELERYGVAYDDTDRDESTKMVIRRPEGGEWVVAGSSKGLEILNEARRCGDRQPLYCRPGR